jgi:hypothetical protein
VTVRRTRSPEFMVGDRAGERSIDGAYFGTRLLRPMRSTLGAARVLARDTHDPREAWERAVAQSLIPESWAERCPRLFEDPLEQVRDHPPTLAHVVAFASDAVAIETVHALAQTLTTALSAWGVCDRGAIACWRLVQRAQWRPQGLHPLLLLHARVAMPKASLFDGVRLSFLGATRDCVAAREVADTLRFAALWRAAATLSSGATGERFSRALSPDGYDPAKPDSWPDPWTPLLEIIALGYAVQSYERERLVLVAPTV